MQIDVASRRQSYCRLAATGSALRNTDPSLIQRTFIATSELEGYGLFVGEDTNQIRVYLGEYKGELINENEAVMRRCVMFIRP